MKLPRNLDASTLIRYLERRWGYVVVRQSGSHIRLQTAMPTPHSITIPNHRPLKPGTLASILKDVSTHHGIQVDELLSDL